MKTQLFFDKVIKKDEITCSNSFVQFLESEFQYVAPVTATKTRSFNLFSFGKKSNEIDFLFEPTNLKIDFFQNVVDSICKINDKTNKHSKRIFF